MSEPFEKTRDGYTISTAAARLDVDAIHTYLSRSSYWAERIPRTLVETSLANSLCFGLFAPDRAQIGFARVITDRATFAYLCDVYVLEEQQGSGLGQWLIETVLTHPDLQALRRFVLVTRDAHGLYRRFGFEALARPETYMEITRPGMYLRGE